jgi:uncharacterized protein YegP (UPF0339 family)
MPNPSGAKPASTGATYATAPIRSPRPRDITADPNAGAQLDACSNRAWPAAEWQARQCFGAGRGWIPGRSKMQTMKSVVKKTSNGQFRFNLVASNGQVVATSETYARKQSALDTIASIQKNAGTATLDDETLPNRRPTPGQHGFAPAMPHRPRGALERRPPGHRCPPRRLLRCQPDGAATTHPRVSHGEHQKGP